MTKTDMIPAPVELWCRGRDRQENKWVTSAMTNCGKCYEGASKLLNWGTTGKMGPTLGRGGGGGLPEGRVYILRPEGGRDAAMQRAGVRGEEPLLENPTSASRTKGQCHRVGSVVSHVLNWDILGQGAEGTFPLGV